MDDATLVQARAILEASLTDRCKVDRPADTWNEATQQTVTTYTPVASGIPCRLVDATSQGRVSQGRVIVTGETVTPVAPLLRCPVTLTGVLPDDRVTITTSADPELVDVELWVTNPKARTLATSRTMECRWER